MRSGHLLLAYLAATLLSGLGVTKAQLAWPSQETVTHLQQPNALALLLPGTSPSGSSDSLIVLQFRRAGGPTQWRERTVPFSNRIFTLDGLDPGTEYELRMAERINSVPPVQSAFSGSIRASTIPFGKYYWLEDSFVETKTTQTTATMALHPVTVPGRLVVGIFVQYQEVMPDGTLGTAKNDKFFRNPWRSERQFVGLKPGTNYLCLVTLFVNPPIPPVKSVGLPFFTLEDAAPVWGELVPYNVSATTKTSVQLFLPSSSTYQSYSVSRRFLQGNGDWSVWSRLGGLHRQGTGLTVSGLAEGTRYQFRIQGVLSATRTSPWSASVNVRTGRDESLIWRWDTYNIGLSTPTRISMRLPQALGASVQLGIFILRIDYRTINIGGRGDSSRWITVNASANVGSYIINGAVPGAMYQLRAIGFGAFNPITDLSDIYQFTSASEDDVPKWESEFVFLPSTTQFSVTISLPNVTNARTTHYNVQYRQVLVSNAYGAWQTLIVIVGVNARATLSCLSQGSQYEVRAQFLDGSTAISLHSAVRTFWTTLNTSVGCDPDCQNGGTCNAVTGRCSCPPMFSGPTCEERLQCTGEGTAAENECGHSCTCRRGRLVNCCRVRKEIHDMTQQERQTFIDTYKASYGDISALLQSHGTNFFSGIHEASSFLPWHRWFILAVENILVQRDCRVVMPYWDWTLRSSDPWNSLLWTDATHWYGGDGSGSCVTTGPFQSGLFTPVSNPCLVRQFSGQTPTALEVNDILAIPASNFADFELRLRGELHNTVHCRIGGTMCSVESAGAPEFFLHHVFIDCIWHRWQQKSAAHRNAGFSSFTSPMPASGGARPTDFRDLATQPAGVCVRCQEPQNRISRRLRNLFRVVSKQKIAANVRCQPPSPEQAAPVVRGHELFRVSANERQRLAELASRPICVVKTLPIESPPLGNRPPAQDNPQKGRPPSVQNLGFSINDLQKVANRLA